MTGRLDKSETTALLVLISRRLGISPIEGNVELSLKLDSVPVSSQLTPESALVIDMGVTFDDSESASASIVWQARLVYRPQSGSLVSRLCDLTRVGLQLSS